MISFNEEDFNLIKIKAESKLFNLVTRNKYYVYGLKQIDNPPISILYNKLRCENNFNDNLIAVVEFFHINGISVEYSENDDKVDHVKIGLRKDIRSVMTSNGKPLLAASILSTIIYCLEGRVDTNQLKTYKLQNVPEFKYNAA